MKKLFGLLVVLLIVVMLGGTACGDDDGLSVEEYFDELAAIAERTNTALDEVQTELSEATYETEEDEVAGTQAGIETIAQALESSAVDVADLDAPDEVAEEHDQFVEDLGVYAGTATTLFEDMQEATTVEEINALGEAQDAEISAAGEAAGASCRSLETVGAELVEGFDIRCPGDEETVEQ